MNRDDAIKRLREACTEIALLRRTSTEQRFDIEVVESILKVREAELLLEMEGRNAEERKAQLILACHSDAKWTYEDARRRELRRHLDFTEVRIEHERLLFRILMLEARADTDLIESVASDRIASGS